MSRHPERLSFRRRDLCAVVQVDLRRWGNGSKDSYFKVEYCVYGRIFPEANEPLHA